MIEQNTLSHQQVTIPNTNGWTRYGRVMADKVFEDVTISRIGARSDGLVHGMCQPIPEIMVAVERHDGKWIAMYTPMKKETQS